MKLQRRRAISKTVRISKSFFPAVRREIVRLTIHPELFKRSEKFVRWSRKSTGGLPPSEIVLHALSRYPDLSLSAAVEAVLIDLLENPFSNEQSTRFARLTPIEKIRITQKRNRTARYLKGLPG